MDKHMLEALMYIRDNGPNRRHYGICLNVWYIVRYNSTVKSSSYLNWLSNAFVAWGLDECYPVECQLYGKLEAEYAYNNDSDKWADDIVGDTRRKLLNKLINLAHKEVYGEL